MWLRRLVGAVMILTFIIMNVVVVVGLFVPEKKKPNTVAEVIAATPVAPTVTLSINPPSVSAGSPSALTWTTSGNPTKCTASGSWSGEKTPFGAESTGRLNTVGNNIFTLTCSNAAGSTQASSTVVVGAASAPPPVVKKGSGSTTSAPAASSYCSGRVPCYGPKDVAGHGSAGNCWGWNGDRVINISGFDAGYHQAKSGISSIEVSQVCGHDLAASLSGSVSAGGQTRNHNATTKSNADRNEIPYFVGYFDASK